MWRFTPSMSVKSPGEKPIMPFQPEVRQPSLDRRGTKLSSLSGTELRHDPLFDDPERLGSVRWRPPGLLRNVPTVQHLSDREVSAGPVVVLARLHLADQCP